MSRHDQIVLLLLEKCIGIFHETGLPEKESDENKYGRFPSIAYIEEQKTIHGRTRLSNTSDVINIWKYEADKLTIQDKNSKVPSPIISKMYYDRAVFTFEILNDKVCLQYFFGPRFGRCIEFDIIEDENIHFGNERTLWVS